MQDDEIRQWTVGETVRIRDDDRLMTVVKVHEDGDVSVAWFEQRKMHLEKVAGDRLEPVVSEVAPPGTHRSL